MPMGSNKGNTQYFFFYIFGEIFEQFLPEFTRNFEIFSKSRKWAISPPELLLKNDEDEDSYIVSGELQIFDAWNSNVEKDEDLKNYHDVNSIINFLSRYSFQYSAEIEFQIDDVDVGSIENGVLSELLSVALLEEWEKKLGLK